MNRILVFFVIFFLLNLAFIPLMSVYGLSICPVLHKGGFWLGCSYSATYVLVLNALNALFYFYFKDIVISSKKSGIITGGIYLLATLVALLVLQIVFNMNYITDPSRAPEVLILSGFLLSVTQLNGLSWVNSKNLANTADNNQNKDLDFNNYWKTHVVRLMLPLATFIFVLSAFLFRQSDSWNKGKIATIKNSDTVITEASLMVLFLIVWIITTYVFYFLSEKDQVNHVKSHLKKVSELDFNYRSSIQSSWGLWAALISNLNQFSRIFGERTRLLKNFSKFVTTSVANEALAKDFDTKIGLSKELTVIVTDIRDFTTISKKWPPEIIVTILNQYFETILAVFSKYSITVDKFIGDGILAYVDSENKTAAENNNLAVKACIEANTQLNELNKKFHLEGLPKLKMGTGIYRGPLVIGMIGAKEKIQYTIIGDTVNRASRLEGLSKNLATKLVITEEIYNTLHDSLTSSFKSSGLHSIRGLEEKISIYILNDEPDIN